MRSEELMASVLQRDLYVSGGRGRRIEPVLVIVGHGEGWGSGSPHRMG